MKIYRDWILEPGDKGFRLAAKVILSPWPTLHEGEDMSIYLSDILDEILPDVQIPTSRDDWYIATDNDGSTLVIGPVVTRYPKGKTPILGQSV